MAKIQTMKDLASHIANKESKKSQVKIGDVREILSIISDLAIKEPIVLSLFIENGLKRAKK